MITYFCNCIGETRLWYDMMTIGSVGWGASESMGWPSSGRKMFLQNWHGIVHNVSGFASRLKWPHYVGKVVLSLDAQYVS